MKRRYIYLLAALLVAAAASSAFFQSRPAKAPGMDDLLGARPSLAERLYPGQADPDVAVMESSVRIGNMLYVSNQDHSTVDIEYRSAGDDQTVSSRSYYPVQPGERGRRPHIKRLYDGPAQVSLDEQIWRLDGTMAEHTRVMVDKSKHVVDFAPDGKTLVGEQLFDPPPPYEVEPLLKKEQRWRPDKLHSLSYLNVFNPDQSRTITAYDDQMHVLKTIQWPKDMTTYGAKIVAYYPGSFKLYMQGDSGYESDIAKYFREDGTLEYKVTISSSSTEVETLDASGTRTILDQTFWRAVQTGNASSKYSYRIETLATFDSQGNKTRVADFQYSGDPSIPHVYFEQLFNATVDGVIYKQIDYLYNDDGVRTTSVYWQFDANAPETRRAENQASKNLRPDQLPAGGLEIHFKPDEDLPIPAPYQGPY